MPSTLSIDNNIQVEDLKEKLKATNLSKDQIEEIIPVILNTLSEIKEIENNKTEISTKSNLNQLSQSIKSNNENVSIDMKNNKGTVIGAMNFNTITNNISITINQASTQPSTQPTTKPTTRPTNQPSNTPTTQPTNQPSSTLTTQPTNQPSSTLTTQPTNQPSSTPSTQPTNQPTNQPSNTPSAQPTNQPSSTPSTQPTNQPSSTPSAQPTNQPTNQPSNTPSTQPTNQPTNQPSNTPSTQPTNQPEAQSTSQLDQDLKLDSYEGYDKALSQLIFEIDGCISTAKYKRGLNKSGKETLKTAKAKLKQYKDIISDKKRMLEHEFKQKNKLNGKNQDKAPLTVSISASEINELKNRRFQWRQKIEFDIKEGQMGESSNTAPWPNQSLEQINKGNNVDRHHIEYDSKLNEALNDAAFLRIIDNNQDRAREFLQAIANNSLSDAQITICQTRMVQLAPYFEKYNLTNQVHRCIQTRGGRYTQSVDNYGNMDGETAYKTGGVVGWLKNTLIKAFPNAKPEQVSNFTNIAVAAGGIFAIYKIGKWFFGKNEKGERNLGWKAAGLAGIYFAPQLLLGKDGFSLLGDILSGKADFGELGYRASNCLWFLNNNSPEVYAQMAPGVLGMSIFPQNSTVKDVRALQQTFSDQNTRRQWYTVTYNRLNKDNSALANEFKNTFNANQYNENERKAFLAKLGITDNTSDDTVIFNEAMKLTDKKTSFELRMKSQGKKRNPAFEKEIDDYLKQGGEFNPNDLKDKDNWFLPDKDVSYTERPEDEQNRKALENQVESLAISDPQKKSELKTAIVRFYNERSIDTKPILSDFSLKMDGNFLILSSHHGQETKIDINNNEIVGFGNEIRFSDLSELLNVADLSNKILETQKGKQPMDMPPFQYKIGKGGRGIYFNDAEGWNFNFDTRVLSGGLGGAIGKIDTLSRSNNADEFAKYLSKRWENNNKVNLDSNNYPILHNFSEKTKIIFTNEQEAKDLEIRLKQIKDGKKFAIGQQGGNPFDISWQFKTFDNRLVFTAINGTKEVFNEDISDKFPTIMRNKDEFLKYMNDKNNGMRGSALSRKKQKN